MITIHRMRAGVKTHGVDMARNIATLDAKLIDQDDGSLRIDDGVVKVWLPKCLTTDNDDGTFTMPQWLAMREKLV